MLPQGVSEVSNGYAAALPGFGSSRGVLKVSREWMDNNPGSWYETDEELSFRVIASAEMSCLCFNGRRSGSDPRDSEHLRRHRS